MITQKVPRKAEVLAHLTDADVRRVYAMLGVERFGSGGEGNWLVKSPFRDDAHPSLTVRKGDGVWSDKATGESGSLFDAVMRGRGCDFQAALAEVARLVGLAGQPVASASIDALTPRGTTSSAGQLAAMVGRDEPVYPYRDEQSTLLYEIIRRVQADGRKSFVARHQTRAGTWRWGLGDGRRVLYRLPELLAADPLESVFVVEGEKDVDRLRSLGLTGTTNPFGAGKWDASYTPALAGRAVVVVADNDLPGMQHAEQVVAAIRDVAQSVRLLRLDELPVGGDISDWLDAGGTVEALLQRAEATAVADPPRVGAIVATSPCSDRSCVEEGDVATIAPTRGGSRSPDLRAVTVRLSEVAPRDVQWLWPDWLPRGKLTILGGHPGTGKSTLAAGFAAALTRGLAWPDGVTVGDGQPGHAIFLLGEDALDDTLRPRLDQLGADAGRVSGFDTVQNNAGKEYTFSLREHMDVLAAEIERESAQLVVIDPLTSFLPSANRNDEGDIRDLLTPLTKLAERTQCAVVGIMHVAKPSAGGRRTALQSLLGATAFGAIARTVLMTAAIPDSDRNVLAVVKSNLAKKPQPIEWSRPDNGPLLWHGPTTLDVESILGGIPGSIRPEPREEAEELLRTLLADGPMPSREVEDAAEEAGISERTMKRARKALDIETQKLGRPVTWYMMLPETDWPAFVASLSSEGVEMTEEAAAPTSDEEPSIG